MTTHTKQNILDQRTKNDIKSALWLSFLIVIPTSLVVWQFKEVIQKFITQSVVESSSPDAFNFKSGNYLFDSYVIWLVLLIVFSLTFFVSLSVKYYMLSLELSKIGASDPIRRLSQIYSNIETIANKMIFEDSDGVRNTSYSFKFIDAKYFVGPSGRTKATIRQDIVADLADVYFFKIEITSDDSGCGAETLDDIRFSTTINQSRGIRSRESDEISYLPTWESRYRKSVCLFFLPALAKGSSASVTYEFEWPDYFSDLLHQGRSRFVWTLKALPRPTNGSFRFEFNFDKSFGNVICENLNPSSKGDALNPQIKDDYVCWIFSNQNAENTSRPISLNFKSKLL